MSDTVDFWKGDFGTAYTARNRVDWRARIPFWDRLVAKYGFRSVYEVGANAGWNFSAIKHTIHGYNIVTHGCEINGAARKQAENAGLSLEEELYFGTHTGLAYNHSNEYELVYTSGVLIHVPPEELGAMMGAIVKASCDYVLAIEYESDQEEEVEYRGHTGKLWRRPYGKMYQDMGLELIETGKLGGDDGFDKNGVTFWLLRK